MNGNKTRLTLLCVCVALPAWAKEKPKAPSISIPTFGEIPKGENLNKPQNADLGMETKVSPTDATYAIVRVQHGKSFLRTPTGANASGGGLQEIALVGHPPATEKFSTVVRVKCPMKVNAPIDLVILDNRGDTVMSSSGEVNYRGQKTDEVDYVIEWAPTPWPAGGDFKMLVRISGQALGTWPLKFALRP